MKKKPDLQEALLDCWETTNRVSAYLVKVIAPGLWNKNIPGYPRKTTGMLAIHLHNVRCMWIKDIGKGVLREMPARLDPNRGTRKELLTAMKQSSKAMLTLLQKCIENEGRLPARPAWLNFPADVVHLLAYFVAHEAHHRGQVIMAARQLGQPLTKDMTGELWQWEKRRSRKTTR